MMALVDLDLVFGVVGGSSHVSCESGFLLQSSFAA